MPRHDYLYRDPQPQAERLFCFSTITHTMGTLANSRKPWRGCSSSIVDPEFRKCPSALYFLLLTISTLPKKRIKALVGINFI